MLSIFKIFKRSRIVSFGGKTLDLNQKVELRFVESRYDARLFVEFHNPILDRWCRLPSVCSFGIWDFDKDHYPLESDLKAASGYDFVCQTVDWYKSKIKNFKDIQSYFDLQNRRQDEHERNKTGSGKTFSNYENR